MFLNLRKILPVLALVLSVNALADGEFDKAPDDKNIKRPSVGSVAKGFVKYLKKQKVFADSSATLRMRSSADDFRVYELELYFAPFGASLSAEGDPNQSLYSREGPRTDAPFKEWRVQALPITVVERMDPNGQSRFQVSKFGVTMGKITRIDKPAGLEYLEFEAFNFFYDRQDLNLGKSVNVRIVGIRVKQVLDLTEDGDVRLVMGADVSAGGEIIFQGKNANLSEEPALIKDAGAARGDAKAQVGVMFKKAFTVSGVGQIQRRSGSAQKAEANETYDYNRYTLRQVGGVLEWSPSRRFDLNLTITKDHYDITNYEYQQDHYDTTTLEKSGLGMNAGIKFTW